MQIDETLSNYGVKKEKFSPEILVCWGLTYTIHALKFEYIGPETPLARHI
jgi:hypothetical protein